MANRESREFFTYGDHCASITLNAPILHIESSKNPANAIIRAITRAITDHTRGLEECVGYALELDGDAYAVHIIGTPVELSRVDGAYSGYSLHISIVPWLTTRDNEKNG